MRKRLPRRLLGRSGAQRLQQAAFYPGNVATNFGAETTSRLMKFIATSRLTRAMLSTPDKGADTLTWLASHTPETDWASGEFYVKRKIGTNLNSLAADASLARGL